MRNIMIFLLVPFFPVSPIARIPQSKGPSPPQDTSGMLVKYILTGQKNIKYSKKYLMNIFATSPLYESTRTKHYCDPVRITRLGRRRCARSLRSDDSAPLRAISALGLCRKTRQILIFRGSASVSAEAIYISKRRGCAPK